jgi:hypothetical protein
MKNFLINFNLKISIIGFNSAKFDMNLIVKNLNNEGYDIVQVNEYQSEIVP